MEKRICDRHIGYYNISKEEFVELFRTAKAMQSSRVRILRAHAACEGYTTTARRLAKSLGYKNHNAVNLQYGLFAKSLALEYGFQNVPQRGFDWLCFLMHAFLREGESILDLKRRSCGRCGRLAGGFSRMRDPRVISREPIRLLI